MGIEEYRQRFVRLPIVEQQRLLNLMKYINKHGYESVDKGLLRGFPKESLEILKGMLEHEFNNQEAARKED